MKYSIFRFRPPEIWNRPLVGGIAQAEDHWSRPLHAIYKKNKRIYKSVKMSDLHRPGISVEGDNWSNTSYNCRTVKLRQQNFKPLATGNSLNQFREAWYHFLVPKFNICLLLLQFWYLVRERQKKDDFLDGKACTVAETPALANDKRSVFRRPAVQFFYPKSSLTEFQNS